MKYKGFTYTPAPKTAWDNLSMLEKSEMMKVAVRNGITDLKTIREKYNEFAEGGDTNDGMTGMMKAKLATAAHFGNPTARRMTNYDTRSFTWPGEYEYDSGIGEPKRGNVFVGSYDNLVTPQIQDTGNGLSFIDNVWSPENDQRSYLQSLKFDNENDARYFGEHYKEIAPMMNLYRMGGHKIHIKPENRGKFTALKERTGHSATWFKEHGTPAQKKMATFALNARHWKHGLGGNLFDGTSEPTQQMNIMAYNPEEDYFTGPSATMPEINVTRKRDGKTYVGLGDFSKRYDKQKEQPYFVSSRTGQLTAGDAMKGIDAATGPLLHWMQPSQYVGAVRDAVEGKNPLTSMLRGNSGVVSEEYAQEHPWLSTVFNLGTDAAILGGIVKAFRGTNKKTSIPKPETYKVESPVYQSELDWSPEGWFGTRATGSYDAEDIATLQSHIPEYLEIERATKANGTWLRMPDGSTWKGDPRSWVQLQSKAGQKLSQERLFTGMNMDKARNPEYAGEVWADKERKVSSFWAGEDSTYPGKVLEIAPARGERFIVDAKRHVWNNIPREQNGIVLPITEGWSGTTSDGVMEYAISKGYPTSQINNVIEGSGDLVTDVMIHPQTPRKSLLGNNGNFDFSNPNIYKGLIPLGLIGTTYGLTNK